MIVRNPNTVKWEFFLKSPDGGDDVKITGKNKMALLMNVLGQMAAYDNASQGAYTKKATEKALALKLSFQDYIAGVIEHQICLRIGEQHCYSSGIGDDIHMALGKVDDLVSKLPPAAASMAKTIIAKVTPSKSKTLRGCSSCGGTRSFDPNSDNLGRAGRLNK